MPSYPKKIYFIFLLWLLNSPLKAESELVSDIEQADVKQEATVDAFGKFTGNIDLTTNYVFRGISQSDNNPAIQGGLRYTILKPGLYVNVWGSNVKFPDVNGNTVRTEVDTTIGINNTIQEDFSYDLNLTRYNYPHAKDVSYNEWIASGTYKFLTLLVGYSNNVFDTHKKGIYYNSAVNFDVPEKYVFNWKDISVGASLGHYSLPDFYQSFSYNDYSAWMKKKYKNFSFILQWTRTNGGFESPPLDNNHWLGTVVWDLDW